jgi:hypothetical protein
MAADMFSITIEGQQSLCRVRSVHSCQRASRLNVAYLLILSVACYIAVYKVFIPGTVDHLCKRPQHDTGF